MIKIKTWVFASNNINKLKEIQFVASDLSINIYSIPEIEKKLNLPKYKEPNESGNTYYENALIKAKACYDWCGLPSIGDDSGLEIEILNGAPGIFSARYGGSNTSHEDKIKILLDEIKALEYRNNIINRKAKFRSVIVALLNYETIYKSEGILEGEIIDTPIFGRGFGYDPIVRINEFSATLSELEEEFVFKHGFRARAAKALFRQFS